ncbi:MAG: sugar phosphate isomerase/epimerase [Clostridiales bacterium]|nr:sugar phosphate isomerase/epimerase [Clostridiales bacterium]
MQLSVVNGVFGGMTLEESLKFLTDNGVYQLELGVGGYPGTIHADAKKLIKDEGARKRLLDTFAKYNCTISALSVHGNCVHPNKEIAQSFEEDFRSACILAGQIGVKRIVTFSGCPGGDSKAQQPNWVTCAWPPEYLDILEYQWNEVLIPYWKKAVAFAKEQGVEKIALEMHPGFCVYNPETLFKLRNAVGDTIGANLDPSHLLWQGMDIIDVIYELGDAIYYFHAKDTEMNKRNVRKNGVLDSKHYGNLKERSWSFRTIGYGDGEWKKIISALKVVGYDDSVSIEHEDALMLPLEGLSKAIAYLKPLLIEGTAGEMWWA